MSDGGPAFPNTFPNELDGYTYVHGMSLRDYFAAAALTGLIANSYYREEAVHNDGWATYSRMAYLQADAMLKAREET